MPKTAILLGATGLTGGILLNMLLEDERYSSIKIFGRNSCNIQHKKLEETITDLLQLETVRDQFKGDVVFCCIGTTKAKTKDENLYTKIDKGIPVSAAKLAKENGIETFIVVSAIGANPDSRISYNRIKGEMEDGVLKQKINHTYILQPSLIKGPRQENRLGEKIAGFFMKIFKPVMLGDLRKFRAISASTISRSMLWLDNNAYDKKRIVSDEIKEITEKL